MKKTFRFFLILAFCASISACQVSSIPEVTFTPEATAMPSATPTETPIPTPTIDPVFLEMTEIDKIIWDAMPETMEDLEGSTRRFDPIKGFYYLDTNGIIVGIWDYNVFNYSRGIVRPAWMNIDGKLIYLIGKEEKIKYPEIISIDNLEGNNFNGVNIYTTARNYTKNPTLSQTDLKDMMEYLLEMYRLGLISQFSEKAMRLGTGDLVMAQENSISPTHSFQFQVPYTDHMSKKWVEEPRMIPFPPAVFLSDLKGWWSVPILVMQKDGTVSGYWGVVAPYYTNGAKIDEGTQIQRVQNFLDNATFDSGGKRMLIPWNIKRIDLCLSGLEGYYLNIGESKEVVCQYVVDNRMTLRGLYNTTITSGFVVEELWSGKYYSILKHLLVASARN